MKVLLDKHWRDYKKDPESKNIAEKTLLLFYRLCRDPYNVTNKYVICPICNRRANHDYKKYRILRKVRHET